MKKVYLLIICTVFSGQVFAQDLYFQKQDFINKIENKIATLSPAEQKEQAILLSSKVFIEYAEDKQTGQINQYYGLMKRYHINEAGAIDNYNKVVLPVSESSDLLAIKVRSISPKGVVKVLGTEAIKETQEDGNTYKMIAVEGVELGGEVEFYYLIKTPIRTFGSEKIHTSIPVRMSEVLIISPEYLKFEAKLYNCTSIKQDTVVDKKKFLGFKINNLEPLLDEKYSTTAANSARLEYKLQYNTEKGENTNKLFTWKDAGSRFFDLMHETSKASTKEIEKVIKKENFNTGSEDASIRSIENYIKSNISIKEDAPNALPAEILKSKFGEEGTIARLYIQFFEAMNVNYEFIIGVNRFNKQFDKTFETWSFLDKYNFYFPNSKKYLDPSNPLSRCGLIGSTIEGTDALFISSITIGDMKTALTKIKNIPFSTADDSFDNIEANISFPANMSTVNIKMTRIFKGHQAGELKGYFMLSNDEERTKITENVLKSALKEDAIFTNSVAKNYNLNSDEVDKDFMISTDAAAKSMIEKAGNKYFFKLGDIIGPQSELYNERPRQQSIDVGNAHKYIRNIKVNLPEGYKVRGLETIKKSIMVDQSGKKIMGFVSDYKQVGNILTITIDEYYNEVLLPLSQYDDFQKVINAAADFNKVTLILEK
jgi:hypothetical protein